MRTISLILFLLLISISGCKKDDKNKNSGTITIDNEPVTTPTYYIYGLHVPTGQKVSILNSSLDVITIMGADNNGTIELYFDTENYQSSFYLFGQYQDLASCKTAFKNLISFSEPLPWTDTGDNVMPNQIWLYKTSNEKYAKIRVISTFSETRPYMPFPYAECNFEWVYQPDGTLTFPGK
jgi:hypothetical protein